MFVVLSLLAAVCFTTGGVVMKISEGLTRFWPSVGCLLLFAGGAALQGVAMRRSEMGSTHIFVLGLEAVLALVFGFLFFKESLSLPKVSGATLIVFGVLLLRR